MLLKVLLYDPFQKREALWGMAPQCPFHAVGLVRWLCTANVARLAMHVRPPQEAIGARGTQGGLYEMNERKRNRLEHETLRRGWVGELGAVRVRIITAGEDLNVSKN